MSGLLLVQWKRKKNNAARVWTLWSNEYRSDTRHDNVVKTALYSTISRTCCISTHVAAIRHLFLSQFLECEMLNVDSYPVISTAAAAAVMNLMSRWLATIIQRNNPPLSWSERRWLRIARVCCSCWMDSAWWNSSCTVFLRRRRGGVFFFLPLALCSRRRTAAYHILIHSNSIIIVSR